MKTFMRLAILTLILMLGSLSVTHGQSPLPAVWLDPTEVQGLDANGNIPGDGGDLVFPIRFTNVDEARTAVSNGYHFIADGVTWDNLTAEWNPAFPSNWDLAFIIGCYPPYCYPYFDQGTFINYFDNGVGFAGLTGASGSGLPADFDDVAYFITLTNVQAVDGGTLTLDSTWWEPANFWLWSGVADDVSWSGPHTFQTYGPPPCSEPYTECWPQPTVLKALENDRILEFYVFCEDNEEVILSSIRVGNIPPYTAAAINGDTLYTDAFIMRFLGASGFRPIPPEGIQSTYTLTYDKTDGSTVSLVGEYVLGIYQGDVNFDTEVNIEDIVLLTDYLYANGPKAELFGYEMGECMDVDASGRFDLLDIQELVEIVGI